MVFKYPTQVPQVALLKILCIFVMCLYGHWHGIACVWRSEVKAFTLCVFRWLDSQAGRQASFPIEPARQPPSICYYSTEAYWQTLSSLLKVLFQDELPSAAIFLQGVTRRHLTQLCCCVVWGVTTGIVCWCLVQMRCPRRSGWATAAM